MVTTTTAALQIYDSDKRKRQTVERAKAAHLTRQLQLRLQYAKLKVDHGWQRQNLNEVENLYFHHSHLRGPKSHIISSLTSTAMSAAAPSHDQVHTNTSFTSAPSVSTNASNTISVNDQPYHPTASPIQDPSSPLPPPPPPEPNSFNTPMPVTTQDVYSLLQNNIQTNPGCDDTSPQQTQPNVNSDSPIARPLQSQYSVPGNPTTMLSQPLFPTHSIDPTTHPSTSLLGQSMAGNLSLPNTFSHYYSSSTTFPVSAPSPALTYDSFWSNHNAARSFRSSFSNLLGSDVDSNRVTARALLSSLSAKNIASYFNSVPGLTPDFFTTTPSPPASDVTPTPTPTTTRRGVPNAIIEGLRDS
ncbi:hypothetical protein AX17_004288 [Amanita inopinata Kibby_2008]|nr:hypothetical protein AX17_004288 [Amanita inopinata Kibby_2008]